MAFNFEEFKRKRIIKKWIGISVFWGGLVLMLMDMDTNFPTPERGPYPLIYWIPIIIAGAIFWILSKKLPISEIILISQQDKYKGFLTATDVMQELNVSINMAEKILYEAERRGYARAEQKGEGELVWHISSSRYFDGPALLDSPPADVSSEVGDFLAPALDGFAKISALKEHLEGGAFYQDVRSVCYIINEHIQNFRKNPSHINHFTAFPHIVNTLANMLEKYILLYPHRQEDSVGKTLEHTQSTFVNVLEELRKMYANLLKEDVDKLEVSARVLDSIIGH